MKTILNDRKAAEFAVTKYRGRRPTGLHSSLVAGEFRDLVNWDIVRVEDQDELHGRRGSQLRRPASSPEKWGTTDIQRTVTWDVGAEEYEIVQLGATLRAQALLTPANPVTILDFDGGAFSLGSTVPADLFIHGDRLFVIHPSGNKVVEWNGSTFRGRPMGMTRARIQSIAVSSGPVIGRYVYAVEKVYQVDGADILVSSPNRKLLETSELAVVEDTVSGFTATVTIQNDSLDDDDLWTHIRLWRTKNLVADLRDPANIIEAQGREDELYEVALVTRAEIESATMEEVATSDDLPPGNANVRAGDYLGVYAIEDENPDSFLFNMVGLDRIELEPLPAGTVGCFHAGRVWVSGVDSSNDILYSNARGTKYSELYDPENIVETGQDGQAVVRLFGFERDLLGLKEGKTGRLVGGDPDQSWETLDPRIGVAYYTLAEYLPGLGIIAITNDDPALKLFGLDYRWTAQLNGVDFALPIQDEIADLNADDVRFKYANGKIYLSAGDGTFHILHALHRRGWGRYSYPMDIGHTLNLFTFAGGTRIGVIAAEAYTVEIEVKGLTTDASMEDDTEDNAIPLTLETHQYQSAGGRHFLEMEWYSVIAQLSAPITAVPFANGLPWPAMDEEGETDFVITPYNFPQEALREREYRLYLKPAQVGRFKWNRYSGNFLHLRLETTAPAVLRSQVMRAFVDTSGHAFLAQDPFQVLVQAPGIPTWASDTLLHLPFDEPTGDIARDVSGLNRHHEWNEGGDGSHTYDADLVPSGGQSVVAGTQSGYHNPDWTGTDFIGDDDGYNSSPITFEWVFAFPDLSANQTLHFCTDGVSYWYQRALVDGSLEFTLHTVGDNAISRRFFTDPGTVLEGDDEYSIQFVLSNGGLNGQYYIAPLTGPYELIITDSEDL